MKHIIIAFAVFLTLSACAVEDGESKTSKTFSGTENKISKLFCTKSNFPQASVKREYILEDKTRVDCLVKGDTKTQAIEVDRPKNWAECVGQALYYGIQTEGIPVCALFQDDKTSDKAFVRFVRRVRVVAERYKDLELICISPTGKIVDCPKTYS